MRIGLLKEVLAQTVGELLPSKEVIQYCSSSENEKLCTKVPLDILIGNNNFCRFLMSSKTWLSLQNGFTVIPSKLGNLVAKGTQRK